MATEKTIGRKISIPIIPACPFCLESIGHPHLAECPRKGLVVEIPDKPPEVKESPEEKCPCGCGRAKLTEPPKVEEPKGRGTQDPG
jgi:hypothetical protein